MREPRRMLIVGLLMLCGMSSVAQAQLFPNARWNRQSSAGCPGGICPTSGNVFSNRFSASASISTGSHWTHPGTISNHLQTGHGVNPAGMSQQQMLNMHDALHEGRSIPQAAPIQYRPAPQAPRIITSSTITIAPPLPPVASRPNDIPIAVAELTTFVPMAAEPGFRGQLRGAITESRKAGKIDIRSAVKLQRLTFTPAFVDAAQDMAVAQMVLSGDDPDRIPRTADGRVDVAGINWDGLGKFFQLLLPILLEFLKGVGL